MKASGEVKIFIAICIVAIALVSVAVYPAFKGAGNVSVPGGPKISKLSREALLPPWTQMKGKPDAEYTLVEFGDYQCSSCKLGMPIANMYFNKFKDRMNFAFHHYRITPRHNNSFMLATASMAAAEQGKFWEMHDALFEHQDMFATSDETAVINALTGLARDLKLDILRFRAALNSDSAVKAMQREQILGDTVHVANTPTYYFVPKNGKPKEIYTNVMLDTFMKDPKIWQQ